MTHEDIEATKAPLMEHLIELRSRLIKALIAFARDVRALLRLRQAHLQYSGVAVRLVAGPENSKFIYTALLEYFITQFKLAMFGAAFLSFPVVAAQIYMFVAPASTATSARRSCPIWSRRRSSSRSARRWSISSCCRC